jgi:hypothetical protein
LPAVVTATLALLAAVVAALTAIAVLPAIIAGSTTGALFRTIVKAAFLADRTLLPRILAFTASRLILPIAGLILAFLTGTSLILPLILPFAAGLVLALLTGLILAFLAGLILARLAGLILALGPLIA